MAPSPSPSCPSSSAAAGPRARPSVCSPRAGCPSASSAGASARSSVPGPLSSGESTVPSSSSMPCACLSSASAPRRPAPRACPTGVPPGPPLPVDPPPVGVLPADLRASAPPVGAHSACLPLRPCLRSCLPPSPRRCPGGEGPWAPLDGVSVRPPIPLVAILSVVPRVLFNQDMTSRSSPQLKVLPQRMPSIKYDLFDLLILLLGLAVTEQLHAIAATTRSVNDDLRLVLSSLPGEGLGVLH